MKHDFNFRIAVNAYVKPCLVETGWKKQPTTMSLQGAKLQQFKKTNFTDTIRTDSNYPKNQNYKRPGTLPNYTPQTALKSLLSGSIKITQENSKVKEPFARTKIIPKKEELFIEN
jgi:hypothetical protein